MKTSKLCKMQEQKTNSMKHSPGEVNSHSASKESNCIYGT